MPLEPTKWVRDSTTQTEASRIVLPRARPIINVRATLPVGRLRIGLWDGEKRLTGFVLPFVPANSLVSIDTIARRTFVSHDDGEPETVNNYTEGWDGPVSYAPIPHASYTLTVDQEQGLHMPVQVEVRVAQSPGR